MLHTDQDTLTMTYSSLLQKDGKSAICVRFERKSQQGNNYAEALLPDYRIQKQLGFSPDEILQLEDYLKTNKKFILEESQKISNLMHWF